LNLFISSFRFGRPVVSLYRIVLPFTGILAAALLMIMYIPKLSTVTTEGAIARAYADAKRTDSAPREAWQLQCVQEDRNNPLPCTDEDRAEWGADGTGANRRPAEGKPDEAAKAAEPDEDAELLRQMMGGADADAGAASPSTGDDDEAELLKAMMQAGSDAGAAPTHPAKLDETPSEEELLEQMMNVGKDGG
jgi:hypothetical protein